MYLYIFQQTWRDWKSNVLKKQAENKRYAGGTGGGPPKKVVFTEVEEDLLDFLTPDASGLMDIPQPGFSNQGFHCPPVSDTKQCESRTVDSDESNNISMSMPVQSKSHSVFGQDVCEVSFF